MVKGLWNYAVKAADMEKTVRYYQEYMDAEVLLKSRVLGCNYYLIRIGQTRIIVFDKAAYEEQFGMNLSPGFLHVVYEVDDHDVHIARLRKSGVRFLIEPTVIETDFDTRKIAFVEDIDGVRTEITQILKIKKKV